MYDFESDTDVAEISVSSQASQSDSEDVVKLDGNGDPPQRRKKVSRRRRITRPKQTGCYVPKSSAIQVKQHEGLIGDHDYHQPFQDEESCEPESPASVDITNQPESLASAVNVDQIKQEKSELLLKESAPSPPLEKIKEGIDLMSRILPDNWIVIATQKGLHMLLLPPPNIPMRSIQREIVLNFDGSVDVIVHCNRIPADEILKISPEPVIFNEVNFKLFCKRGLDFCWGMSQFIVCVGADHEESRSIWSSVPNTYSDLNPYLEESFNTSCRSKDCERLIPLRLNSRRCPECNKVLKSLKERSKFATEENVKETTANIYLTSEQALAKLKNLHEQKRKGDKKISYLESKVAYLLEKEGVDLDEDDHMHFSSILEKSNVTGIKRVFLEEQLKIANLSDSRSHRWHPTMIRLAIQIKQSSSATYNLLRDSGAINLPHPRTLFDYTSYIAAGQGVNKGVLNIVSEEVSKLKHPHQRYHALIFDEMHVSQNLVYRKSDGALVGYAYLDEVDKEIKRFGDYLEGKEEPYSPKLATTMLAYMVKGLTSDIKYVIGSYPCKDLNANMVYSRTWEMISHCEGAGIKILALVCDGSAINRSFFKMHAPITETVSGIVFDTRNFCSEDRRPLFFISDVAHLLKTIRNCLFNSRENEGGKFRHLTVNGEKLVWKHIIRLYNTYKGKTLRKNFKLNVQNVFLNSYSIMRVKLAAQILSQTTANALKKEKWPGTTELIKFIENVNKFFDVLNGAHSAQHIRLLNDNLKPYTSSSDERFTWLEEEFWNNYILKWREETEKLSEVAKEKEKNMLSYQTVEGIEITIKGFKHAVSYLLDKAGATFVNARAFSQDPLEQHFSRQRGSLGGSRNPNPSQFDKTVVNIAVGGQIKSQSRHANVEADPTPTKVSTDPLAKVRRNTKRKGTNVTLDPLPKRPRKTKK